MDKLEKQKREAMYARILARLDDLDAAMDRILGSPSSSLDPAPSPASIASVSHTTATPSDGALKVFDEMPLHHEASSGGVLRVMYVQPLPTSDTMVMTARCPTSSTPGTIPTPPAVISTLDVNEGRESCVSGESLTSHDTPQVTHAILRHVAADPGQHCLEAAGKADESLQDIGITNLISAPPIGMVLPRPGTDAHSAHEVFEVMPHGPYAFSLDIGESEDMPHPSFHSAGNLSHVRCGLDSKPPKPPWLLCVEVAGSWFEQVHLTVGCLHETSPWLNDKIMGNKEELTRILWPSCVVFIPLLGQHELWQQRHGNVLLASSIVVVFHFHQSDRLKYYLHSIDERQRTIVWVSTAATSCCGINEVTIMSAAMVVSSRRWVQLQSWLLPPQENMIKFKLFVTCNQCKVVDNSWEATQLRYYTFKSHGQEILFQC